MEAKDSGHILIERMWTEMAKNKERVRILIFRWENFRFWEARFLERRRNRSGNKKDYRESGRKQGIFFYGFREKKGNGGSLFF